MGPLPFTAGPKRCNFRAGQINDAESQRQHSQAIQSEEPQPEDTPRFLIISVHNFEYIPQHANDYYTNLAMLDRKSATDE
jgi:hypothetical protein